MSRVALLAASLGALAGCAGERPIGAIGATLALVDGGRLAVVEPDRGELALVDADTLDAVDRVQVGEEPRALIVAFGRAYVVTRRGGELVEVALDGTPRVLRRQAICTGPRAIAATPAGGLVVACEWDGSVRAIDPTTLLVTTLADDLHRPTAVAAAGDAVFALEATSGRLLRLAGTRRSVGLTPDEDGDRPALAHMTAHAATALAFVDGGRTIAVAFELVNASEDGGGEPVVDGYGALADGRPKINPALRLFSTDELAPRATPSTYARYDGAPALRCNGPVALAALDDGSVLIAHRSSSDLARLAPDAAPAAARLRTTWRVAAGPAGIAVDPAHRLAFIDSLDGAITRVSLDDAAAPLVHVRAVTPAASPAALAGRRLFLDATNPHLSPAGVVACATCHPDGGDDEQVWFIQSPSIAAKRRLTPHLGNAGAATAPYHWDGGLADRTSLVISTVQNLMAGDALLVDGDAVAAYLDELVRPPVAPPPVDAAASARGAARFSQAGCATCHPPPLYTDLRRHAVLTPSAGPDALPSADTPSLRGVFSRRSFFHDGSASSLGDVLERRDALGHGDEVADEARADLIEFLRTL